MEVLNLIDAIRFFFILLIAFAAPLVDAQVILPASFFPGFLTDFIKWYGGEFGNYLVVDRPYFFMGIAWIQLLVNWPLSIASLYAFFGKKSWFNTTCLGLGFSFLSAIAAIYAELLGSKRASEKLLIFYFIFFVFDCFTIFGSLLPLLSKFNYSTRENQKKRS